MYKYFSAIYRQKYNLHFQPFLAVGTIAAGGQATAVTAESVGQVGT